MAKRLWLVALAAPLSLIIATSARAGEFGVGYSVGVSNTVLQETGVVNQDGLTVILNQSAQQGTGVLPDQSGYFQSNDASLRKEVIDYSGQTTRQLTGNRHEAFGSSDYFFDYYK